MTDWAEPTLTYVARVPVALSRPRGGPVFVDPHGRRLRRLRHSARVVAAAAAAYLLLLGLGLAGPAAPPFSLIPGVGGGGDGSQSLKTENGTTPAAPASAGGALLTNGWGHVPTAMAAGGSDVVAAQPGAGVPAANGAPAPAGAPAAQEAPGTGTAPGEAASPAATPSDRGNAPSRSAPPQSTSSPKSSPPPHASAPPAAGGRPAGSPPGQAKRQGPPPDAGGSHGPPQNRGQAMAAKHSRSPNH